MNTFIEFADASAYDAWIEIVNETLGYPNPATRTLRYTAPIYTAADGTIYCPFDALCPEALIATQTTVNADTLRARGWQMEHH